MNQEKLLSKVVEKTQNTLAETSEQLRQDYNVIIQNQNDLTLAVITLYRATEKIAKHLKIELDEPLIDMEVEE